MIVDNFEMELNSYQNEIHLNQQPNVSSSYEFSQLTLDLDYQGFLINISQVLTSQSFLRNLLTGSNSKNYH